MTNLNIGDTFIIKGTLAHNDRKVMKIEIQEVTQKTVQYLNLDTNNTVRKTLDEFYDEFEVYEVLETVGN